ncbi:MAG TPA: phenylalanine--tRNA ligase subunit beta, partial [bacterium]|nr:phenylalanine--tRNA ligase subunit beta [bacterium]
DLLSLRGLAREISALLRLPSPALLVHPDRGREASVQPFSIEINAPQACPFYAGALMDGVQVKDFAPARRARLVNLNQRSISNVVDITNYVLLELGQPLHAFDADRISGGIVVRFARTGEVLTTLDGVERTLNESVLVIADHEKPLALAGIMGGQQSEIGLHTKRILLESAFFNPQVIRMSRKSLGLETEASIRFERGVDPDLVVVSLERAKQLLAEAAGGTVRAAGRAGELKRPSSLIPLHFKHVEQVLGIDIAAEEVESILQGIGCKIEIQKERLGVVPPAYRRDLQEEIDLIEEVARFHDYERLPSRLPRVQILASPDNQLQANRERLRDLMVSAGFDETVSHSLMPVYGREPGLKLINPQSEGQQMLRKSLSASLLRVGLDNLNRGNLKLHLFEIGSVYETGADRSGESQRLAVLLKSGPHDLLQVKALVSEVARRFALEPPEIGGPGCLDDFPGIWLNPPERKNFALVGWHETPFGTAAFAEINLDQDLAKAVPPTRYRTWPKFPAVVRDFSFICPDRVPWAEIQKTVKALSDLIAGVEFFDLYRAPELPENSHSLAFSVRFQSSERTLTRSEVDQLQAQILERLATLGLSLRQ